MHRQRREHSRDDASVADAVRVLGFVVLALGIVVYAHIVAARSVRDLERHAPPDQHTARDSMINPSLSAERIITIRVDLDPVAAGGYTYPHVEQ